ncbi:MAG: GNAT family N-acetyltransferase [Oxalobacteraceae bacterium]|nr:MAG: GNAT family N-acetyltransferase [Oxalobacteraceae bacterium]
METMSDWGSLQRLTAEVPRTAPGYATNLYASRAQIERWCAAGGLRALVTDGAVLVVRVDRDFDRVYHVARDLRTLTAALVQLPAGRYVADLVGQGEAVDPECAAYVEGGFASYAFLRRMARVRVSASLPAGDVVIAVPEDADAVAAFLERLLDRFVEQLPELDELRTAAREGRLLLVRRDVELAGMLMYDVQGQLAHLRFWHVDPGAHGAGIGRRLMGSFLSRCAQARRIVLWVIGDNDRSIAIYRHYGFEPDGLLDRVMIANKG